MILLPRPLKYWNYSEVPPHLTKPTLLPLCFLSSTSPREVMCIIRIGICIPRILGPVKTGPRRQAVPVPMLHSNDCKMPSSYHQFTLFLFACWLWKRVIRNWGRGVLQGLKEFCHASWDFEALTSALPTPFLLLLQSLVAWPQTTKTRHMRKKKNLKE